MSTPLRDEGVQLLNADPSQMSDDELRAYLARLSPKAKADLARRVDKRLKEERRVWFCGDRECDGKPHGAYNYAHARGSKREDQRGSQYPPLGTNWYTWLLGAGRGAGKALDVDTPILTGDGWTTMGQVQTGAVVYDEHGLPCNVVQAHDFYVAETMYRITFSDGSSIDADGEHLWVAWDHLDRKRHNRAGGIDFPDDWAARAPMTTAVMHARQRYSGRGDREFCIPIAGPLSLPYADLPIEPYALGAWLGDGTSACAELTVSVGDYDEMAALVAEAGEPLTGGRPAGGSSKTYAMGARAPRRGADGRMVANDSMHSRLRALGLLRNKYIPDTYLLAGMAQRLELLRGLMDTDGYADVRRSTVEFCSTSRALADGVLALARSLSERPVLSEGRATIDGRDVGTKYRVTWRPSMFTPFSLQRKASLIRPAGRQALRLRHRMVVSVEPIKRAVVRCLTVDSPNSMYLAGKALIPTHNTRTGSEYTRYIARYIPSLALIGPTGPAVRSVMIEGPSGLVKACEAAGESWEYEPSKARFTFSNGARAQLFSAEEPDRIRGGNFGFFWGDEPAHWDDPQAAWDQALFANRIGRRPHALATTTPLPSEFIKGLMAAEDTVYVGGSTYDNMANLAEAVVRKILAKYEGTFLGRQEIHGEIIDDREGALWRSEQFAEEDFYFELEKVELDRVLVGIDPAGSNNKRSDQTGIVVGGRRGDVLHAIDDFSGKYSPSGWAQKAMYAYELYKADAIVVERNYGGDMCRATLKAEGFEGRIIEAQATDGKRVRAEPIAAKYEQKKARHRRGGRLGKLESEMVSWIPGEGKSPNRLDAWVWVCSGLIKGRGRASMGDPTMAELRAPSYRGPGSAWAKKQAKRGRY